MLTILVTVPLLVAALIAVLLNDRHMSGYVSLFASVLSLLLALYLVMNNTGLQTITWFSVPGFTFSIMTELQQLNALMLLLVAALTMIMFVYSLGFMKVPSEQGRYYFEMCIFAASMMLFAISANFITLLISWELISLASYLLIGFWHANAKAQGAARKAMTIVLLGDILMFVAMLLLWNAYGALSFAGVLQAPSKPEVGFALMLLIVAAFTKSAQFPFNEWLPDAMEAPAPSSALLLSSTMPKAGVFLLVVLLPLFARYDLLGLLVVSGLVTALLSVSNALAESNIKRMLAYSAIGNLGLIVVALGFNALSAAMLLFIVQTFYTALLFMCAGAMMLANDNEDDIYRIRSPSLHSPLFLATLIGAVSVAGMFPLSGFFASSSIGIAASSNMFVYSALVLVSMASSIYAFKWALVPMRPGARSEIKGIYSTMPISIMVPIYALEALTVFSSFAYMYLPKFLGTFGTAALGFASENTALEGLALFYAHAVLTMLSFSAHMYMYLPAFFVTFGKVVLNAASVTVIIECAAAIAGFAFAYVLYLHPNPYNMKKHLGLYAVMYNGVLVNIFYQYVARAVLAISNVVYVFDHALYLFMRRSAGSAARFGSALRIMTEGREDVYVPLLVVGAIVVMVLLVVW